ncbi:methyltransferase-16 family protein [Nitzschia inconspicua]|uniref:Methyltransferase-16 family protein n=1 Tax=Nitzschia inconspicua TaxID=303405 RepID=A0A9K3PA50_9STRA|nr:methyltransferase-16 family protein [Nitzschia inconspicua]KAG7352933.1 methyltransferase-16 family protein [Nitzschia inconspicua]
MVSADGTSKSHNPVTSFHNSITTDEGVIIHERSTGSNRVATGGHQGFVWGSVLWPSGVSLAKYLAWKGPAYVQSKARVLELGSGTGIVGLTAAKIGAPSVTLTDNESELWSTMRRNIESNGFSEKQVRIHGLDWRDPSTFLCPPADFSYKQLGIRSPSYEYPDLVLAADVLYSGMDKLFARVLSSHLASEETAGEKLPEALLACPFRKDSPLEGFFEVSMRLGLTFERLEDDQGCAVGGFHGITPSNIFSSSEFVPLVSDRQRKAIANDPTFSSYNTKNIQIFRVQRVGKTAEESFHVKRVSRL